MREERPLEEFRLSLFKNFIKLDDLEFLPFRSNSIESKLILNISPHKNCNRNAIIKLNYFSQLTPSFNLLLSSEEKGLRLLLNGFIPIATIHNDMFNLSHPPKSLYSFYDNSKLMSIISEDKGNSESLHLVEFPAGILKSKREEIVKYNTLISYIGEILDFVDTSYSSAEAIVRDILRHYNNKINLIDDTNLQNVNPCEQLFRFLHCGITSSPITNFLTKQVYDTKILEKLDETLYSSFSQLHDLLLQSIQNSLQRAFLILNNLYNLSTVKSYQQFGISLQKLQNIEQMIIKLYTMGESLLVESTQAKFDIRNLLVWLNKATIKSNPQAEVEIENSKSYLNKYTVDFNRLHAFIAEEQIFKLQHLMGYFSKSTQSKSLKMRPAEFRLLTKKVSPPNPEFIKTTHQMEKLFEVEDIPYQKEEPMQIEFTYQNFKMECKELIRQYQEVASVPVAKISNLIEKTYEIYLIGQANNTDFYNLQIKPLLVDDELCIYYVERNSGFDSLVKFNCHTKKKSFVISKKYHILSLTVSNGIIAALEEKVTMKKIVGEIINPEMNGGQLQLGKVISRAEGELDIDSSPRGLNSLVIDKNKLIIFD